MALKDNIKMSCKQATSLVEKKRDKKLVLSELFRLWVHLGYCSICALFFEQSKILDDSAKSYASKVTNEQKSYTLDPKRKAEIAQVFDTELENQK